MVQRGPTHVVSSATIRRLLALHSESGPPLEIADLINASMTTTLILMLSIGGMDQNKAHDKYVSQRLTVSVLYLISYKGSYLTASLREDSSTMMVLIVPV